MRRKGMLLALSTVTVWAILNVIYLLELSAALYYTAMRPALSTFDYIVGGIIISGSLLILIIPRQGSYTHQSKDFITD